MVPNYDLGKLIYIPVNENKKTENSDDETDSKFSESSAGIKDRPHEFTKKNMGDIDSVNKHKNKKEYKLMRTMKI